jgi:hypothetical protein
MERVRVFVLLVSTLQQKVVPRVTVSWWKGLASACYHAHTESHKHPNRPACPRLQHSEAPKRGVGVTVSSHLVLSVRR